MNSTEGLRLTIRRIGAVQAPGTRVLSTDWPVLVLFSGLFYAFGYDNAFNRLESGVLFLLLGGYVFFLLQRGKKAEDPAVTEELDTDAAKKSGLVLMVFLVAGIVALYFGSEWFLHGGVALGKALGMTEKMIGVTIVAFGTSAPELAASIIAAYRKVTDIALGNLVGSNIFNIGAVLGITGLVSPLKIDPQIMNYDMFWMLGIAIILFPLMIFRNRLSIPSGVFLFGLYASYIALQIF